MSVLGIRASGDRVGNRRDFRKNSGACRRPSRGFDSCITVPAFLQRQFAAIWGMMRRMGVGHAFKKVRPIPIFQIGVVRLWGRPASGMDRPETSPYIGAARRGDLPSRFEGLRWIRLQLCCNFSGIVGGW